MKKKIIITLSLLIMGILTLSPVISYAGNQSGYYDYANVSLYCYIKCTNSYGEGRTTGAGVDGLFNYLKLVTYKNNGAAIQTKQVYSKKDAYLKNSSGSPYSARTFHAAADYDYNQLLPIYQQLQLSEDRY